MTVPGRIEAAEILLSLDPPAWFVRHASAVAEVASWLAHRLRIARPSVDLALIEAAALLHDVDKLLDRDDPAARLRHGDGSAAWLSARGFGELGPAVAAHPVTRLLDADGYERWSREAPIEDRVVAYADKRAGQRLESMEARFRSWERRYPDGWSRDVGRGVRRRAARLEEDVCGAAGASPQTVARLRWVGSAIRTARAGRS